MQWRITSSVSCFQKPWTNFNYFLHTLIISVESCYMQHRVSSGPLLLYSVVVYFAPIGFRLLLFYRIVCFLWQQPPTMCFSFITASFF
ncbi:hypothetical protein VIGAN_UM021500 [Vigna angularis var. angularis]|uniref:Uncharacterized protein n=1 Tax=Vigna angularis var. angularis TaxID=157739 RepID=A0A0S3TDC5_PHAAN|nr:hypothetical protein VIGAN_UM021500 [Vigna angularis var. angularis]